MATGLMIVGSRHFVNEDVFHNVLSEVVKDFSLTDDVTVISCGSLGSETLGSQWAKSNGLVSRVFHADWAGLGTRASFVRSGEMLNAVAGFERSLVVVFWDGRVKSVKSTIDLAVKRNVETVVFDLAGNQVSHFVPEKS